MPTTRIDANRIRYVYPLLRKVPRYGEIASGGASTVEVAKISFNNEEQKSYTFTKDYTSIPICVISPEDENVNVFITSLTTTIIQISSSAPFTGFVHIHIYPDDES
ncbi:hypothetical protein [Winogradskyella sp.]|jgi:hypothetical protein|uniref:hypothetical protein n=1 Tax=Winogradskyella sp. TaxID=1883156 RepID=UPI003F69A372